MSEPADVPMRDAPRATPWELVFGSAVFDASVFEEVARQAESAGAVTAAQLFMLPAAGELLRSMTPPEGGREIVDQVRALIHAAFRFHLFGCNVYRVAEAHFAGLLARTEGAGSFPLPAGYVQLPRNALWARVDEAAAPEPVDGFFWSMPADGAHGPLDLLFALGIRPGRPGLSLFDLHLESPQHLAPWAAAQARPDGTDFANILPGGELQDYRALTNGAEALKLAALCAAHIGAGEWIAQATGDQRIHERRDG